MVVGRLGRSDGSEDRGSTDWAMDSTSDSDRVELVWLDRSVRQDDTDSESDEICSLNRGLTEISSTTSG